MSKIFSFGTTASRRISTATLPTRLPMKPNTPLRGLDIFKSSESPPVALDRSQYPSWLSDLSKPFITLAALRRLPLEQSTEEEQLRYLKLTRRGDIKEKNARSAR
jgi:hypothetical protein